MRSWLGRAVTSGAIALTAACTQEDLPPCGSTQPVGQPLQLTVHDAATSAPICDARVTLQVGTAAPAVFAEAAPSGTATCAYTRQIGAVPYPTKGTITVERDGYEPATIDLALGEADHCGRGFLVRTAVPLRAAK